jgi:hypothetical protein
MLQVKYIMHNTKFTTFISETATGVDLKCKILESMKEIQVISRMIILQETVITSKDTNCL